MKKNSIGKSLTPPGPIDSKSSLFKAISFLLITTFFTTSTLYAAPANYSTLRQPATAVAIVDTAPKGSLGVASREAVGPVVRKTLAAVLAGVLAVSAVSCKKEKVETPKEEEITMTVKIPASIFATPESIANEIMQYMRVNPKLAEEKINDACKILRDKDKNWLERNKYAEVLGILGPAAKPAIPALIEALKDENPYVRATVTESLGKIGPITKDVVPALIKTLQGDEDGFVKGRAAYILGNIGPVAEGIIPALIKALDDDDKDVRIAAINALVIVNLSTMDTIPELEGVMPKLKELAEKDEAEDVRFRAERAISDFGYKRLLQLRKQIDEQQEKIQKQLKRLQQDKELDSEEGAMLPSTLPLRPEGGVKASSAGTSKALPVILSGALSLSSVVSTQAQEPAHRLPGLAAVTQPVDKKALSEKVERLIKQLESPDKVQRIIALTELSNIGPAHEKVIPALLGALEDSDNAVSSFAFRFLSEMGPAVITVLLDKYGEAVTNKPNLIKLIYMIETRLKNDKEEFKRSLPTFEKLLNHESELVRVYTLSMLEKVFSPETKEAIPVFAKALGNKDRLVRNWAAYALGEFDKLPKDVIPHLAKAVEDKDKYVAYFAAIALSRMGPEAEEALPTLNKILSSNTDPGLLHALRYAIRSISSTSDYQRFFENMKKLGDESIEDVAYASAFLIDAGPPAVPFLIRALLDKNPVIRHNAAWTLKEMGPEAYFAAAGLANLFQSELGSKNYKIRSIALEALAAVSNPKDEDTKKTFIIALTYEKNINVSLQAMKLLGEMGPDAEYAVPYILPFLRDKSPSGLVRMEALRTLGKIGEGAKQAMPVLLRMLDEPLEIGLEADAVVTLASLVPETIGKVKVAHKDSVQELIDMLESSDFATRGWTIMVLGNMGKDAKEAMPHLEKLLKDEKILISEGARKAIQKIKEDIEKSGETIETIRPELLTDLKQLLANRESEDFNTIIKIVKALGELGPLAKTAVPTLESLYGNNIIILKHATSLLKELQTKIPQQPQKPKKESIPGLIKDLKSNDMLTFLKAMSTLSQIGEEAVPLLVQELRNENVIVRTRVRTVLKRIGSNAAPAVEQFIKEEEALKKAVQEAYYKITGERIGLPYTPPRKLVLQAHPEKPTRAYEGVILPFAPPLLGFISGLKDKIKPLNYKFTSTAKDSREPKVVVFDQTVLGRSLELSVAIKNAKEQLSKARFYNALVLLDQPITQEQAQQMLTRLGLNGLFDVVLTYDLISGIYRETYDADTILTYIKLELRQGTIKDENFIILASEEKINSIWQDKIGKVLTMLFKPLEDDNQLHLLSIALAGAIEILANNGQLDSTVQQELNNKIQQLRQGKFQIMPTKVKVDDEQYHQRLREYRDIIIQA